MKYIFLWLIAASLASCATSNPPPGMPVEPRLLPGDSDAALTSLS